MIGIKKPVGIGEMRVLTAQLGGFGVHLRHKSRDSAADIIRQHQRGVIARREHQSVQKILDRYLRADMSRQPHDRALGVKSTDQVLPDGNIRMFQIADVLRCHDERHDLRGRGRITLLIGIFLINDRSGAEVLQIDRVRYGFRVALVIHG